MAVSPLRNVGQHGSRHTLQRKSGDVIRERSSWIFFFFYILQLSVDRPHLLRLTGRHLERAALCWENSSCANGLPQRNQWSVSVISFRRVFVALVKTEQEGRRGETSEQREETAAASSSASE